MSVTHAIKWSFLSEVASKAVTPLVFVILARLLTPEDYGVVAAATMVISFSQIFWEAGMGKAIIHDQGDRLASANAAFWINNLLGVAVAGLLVVSSDVLAEKVFHDSRVALVLKAMALQIFLSAATSVQMALLQKDMQFKRLFWVRLLTVSTPGLISIPLAWHGLGYWALVAGTLAGQVVQVLLLWRMSRWRPSLTFDAASGRRLARFGLWVAISGILGWFYVWADSLFVGIYLGSHELGLYRTGNAFVMMIYAMLFAPLLPVLYSHLSAIQADRGRIKKVLSKVVRIITFFSIPIAFVLYALAGPLAQVVFGSHWHGIDLVISIMALLHGFTWIVGANGEAYRAMGYPQYETKIMAVSLLVYVAAYWLSVQHGLLPFLWARLLAAAFGVAIHLCVARWAMAVSITGTLLYVLKISVAGVPLIIVAHNIDLFGESPAVQLIVAGALAAVWTTAFLWLVGRDELVPEVLGLLRRDRGVHG